MSKTILVTGGAGYIGSHVCWRLHDAGYTPVVLDNLSTGHAWAVRWGDLVQGDIGDADLIRKICADYNPSAVMHFAALTDVAQSMREPDRFFDNNTARAKILFDTAADCGINHFVFSSTAAVYGVPHADGYVNEDTPLQPANPYGESKIRAENALRALDSRGVRSVVLRYFNVAGAAPEAVGIGEAHWPETNLLPRVILSGLGYEGPLSLFGNDYDTPDGTALRDFIHVCDLADAHIAALHHMQNGGASDIVNLGTGHGYSVKQIIDAVETHLNKTIDVRIAPRRAGDVPVMLTQTDKAQRILEWKAGSSLNDIISSAIIWHKSTFYGDLVPSLQSRAAE
ncbi:UDP-glucose 4-epimerase GalE [Micavibrio aeruginosavorus]|uniref:UDP-glucose 4-epimerase GalE n=1 Tax=Micavibrio aeruginosavorus TaxID=349221 RepID=UPI003F4AA59E